ncbi:unnamed protein product [Closterium sp. NIES-64]|nr:unnamed protein product [Closterium sp. NIES-64]
MSWRTEAAVAFQSSQESPEGPATLAAPVAFVAQQSLDSPEVAVWVVVEAKVAKAARLVALAVLVVVTLVEQEWGGAGMGGAGMGRGETGAGGGETGEEEKREGKRAAGGREAALRAATGRRDCERDGRQGPSAGGTSSSTSLVCMDSKHAVYRHFKVPANSVGENGTKVCAHCNFMFVGGVHRCAQHITSWNGMRRREVHLCTAAPKTARDAVKALYESKLKAREAKRAAEIAAVGAVNGRGSDKKKSRMTDFYGDDAACANQAADEAISLFFAALHVPEHHADHPLWRNVQAGAVTVSPWQATCSPTRPAARKANVLLINNSGAVFVESIDTKMEMKTGGYIASILRPIIEKVGPENVVALCFDGGSNYAAACKVLMRDPLVNGGKGKQVLKPARTRLGTNYIAINRLCEVRAGLTQMVLSDEWVEWTAAADRAGADTFKDNILDAAWWTRAEFFAKLMRLPFRRHAQD